MSDKLIRLKDLVEPILKTDRVLDPQIAGFILSIAVNAADSALDPARACGGISLACIDCTTISKVLAEDTPRVCDAIESAGTTVYRKVTREAMPQTFGQENRASY